MKFLLTFAPLFLSSLVVSKSSLFATDQQTLDNRLNPVPGQNPMKFCGDPDGIDSLTIGNVDFEPNPPERQILPFSGKELLIKANGTFTKEVELGAYIHLTIKWGVAIVYRKELDLCHHMEQQVDEQCPIDGERAFTKSVTFLQDRVLPPGKYKLLANKKGIQNIRILQDQHRAEAQIESFSHFLCVYKDSDVTQQSNMEVTTNVQNKMLAPPFFLSLNLPLSLTILTSLTSAASPNTTNLTGYPRYECLQLRRITRSARFGHPVNCARAILETFPIDTAIGEFHHDARGTGWC
ncbi:MAG: hypothetical protein Q9226_008014 [Calogaya cf. arnoldii]